MTLMTVMMTMRLRLLSLVLSLLLLLLSLCSHHCRCHYWLVKIKRECVVIICVISPVDGFDKNVPVGGCCCCCFWGAGGGLFFFHPPPPNPTSLLPRKICYDWVHVLYSCHSHGRDRAQILSTYQDQLANLNACVFQKAVWDLWILRDHNARCVLHVHAGLDDHCLKSLYCEET